MNLGSSASSDVSMKLSGLYHVERVSLLIVQRSITTQKLRTAQRANFEHARARWLARGTAIATNDCRNGRQVRCMAPGEVNAAQCERRGIMGQRIDVPRAGLVGEVPFLVDCCLEDWLVADRSHHADPRLLRWGGL